MRGRWLRGLPRLPIQPGMVVFVTSVVAVVAFDGLSQTRWWQTTVVRPLVDAMGNEPVAGTLLLLAMVGATWAVYVAASWLTSRIGATGSTRTVAKRFAHVLVPVGFAGMVAHSFTLILFEGQLVASTISDPFGLGWDLFGTAGRPIDYSLIQGPSETGWVWYVQVAVLLLGHVVALLLAHDRAMADGEGLAAVRSEYPMVAMLVASMSLGLFTVSAG